MYIPNQNDGCILNIGCTSDLRGWILLVYYIHPPHLFTTRTAYILREKRKRLCFEHLLFKVLYLILSQKVHTVLAWTAEVLVLLLQCICIESLTFTLPFIVFKVELIWFTSIGNLFVCFIFTTMQKGRISKIVIWPGRNISSKWNKFFRKLAFFQVWTSH